MPEVSLPGYYNLQVFATDGTPAESHRLFTYAPGTTTHKAAYTDSAGTTAHTYTSDGLGGQYIALNARGELPAPLWLTVGGYDLTLKTPAGATVWTRRAEGAEEVPTADRPMGGFKHTGAANADEAGEYIVWGQAATLGALTTGAITSSGAVSTGGRLTIDTNIRVFPSVSVSGLGLGGTITTTIPYDADQTQGGGILVVRGYNSGGQPFCAVYAVATSTVGATPSVSGVVLNRAGSSTPSLTVGGAGGYVTVTVDATSSNFASAFGIGF